MFLSLAHLDAAHVRVRFPTIHAMCAQLGLDLAQDRIPVGPAAHYLMGGVATDRWGRTSLPRLFAAGEAACTGVHGANRLASNSLLEGLVFGARAAMAMQQPAEEAVLHAEWRDAAEGGKRPCDGQHDAQPSDSSLDTAGIRGMMWTAAGLFRTKDGLSRAIDALAEACDAERSRPDPSEPAPALARRRSINLLTVAHLIARASLRREESRGGHFRADFPDRDDLHWRAHFMDRRRD